METLKRRPDLDNKDHELWKALQRRGYGRGDYRTNVATYTTEYYNEERDLIGKIVYNNKETTFQVFLKEV